MPVFTRKMLRQTLGKSYLRDMVSALTSLGIPAGQVGGGAFFAPYDFADLSLSGQNLYENATIHHLDSGYDYRVSSFNAGSGAFITSQGIQFGAVVTLLDEFEVNSKVSTRDKDAAIDDTIKRIRVRQEVCFSTGVTNDGRSFYSIEGVASPNYVSDVLDAYYFANPSGTQNRDLQRFNDIKLVMTATGREIRISPALGGSMQVALDAIVELTLGGSYGATINLPDDRWILAGAAAKCYDLLIQSAPGQQVTQLMGSRTSWASEFSKLSAYFAPNYERKIRLQEPETF